MASGIIPIKNQPVNFNTDIDGVDECTDCEGQPFCQLVQQDDTTSFQFKVNIECVSEENDNVICNGDFSAGAPVAETPNYHLDGFTWVTDDDDCWHVVPGGEGNPTSTLNGSYCTPVVEFIHPDDIGIELVYYPKLGVDLKQFNKLVIGESYVAQFTISNYQYGNVNIVGATSDPVSGNGLHTIIFTATGVDFEFTFAGFQEITEEQGFVGCIDDVGVFSYTNNLVYYIADMEGNFLTFINSATQEAAGENILVTFQWDYQDLAPGCYKICVLDQCANTNGQNDPNLADAPPDFTDSLHPAYIAPFTILYDQTIPNINATSTGFAGSIVTKDILVPGICYNIEFDLFISGSQTIVDIFAGSVDPLSAYTPLRFTQADNGHITLQMTAVGNGNFQFFLQNFTSPSFARFIDIENLTITVCPEDYVPDYCSDCFQLAEVHDCTHLLRWRNNEDAFGFKYPDGFYFYMRVAGKLWKQYFEKAKEYFKKSNGERVLLFSDSAEKTKFTVEEIPLYMHEALSTAIDHDMFLIGGDNYTAEENDYTPEWRNSSQLAPITLDLEKNNQQVLKNDNC